MEATDNACVRQVQHGSRMHWEAISAIGEIVSAIAVVISLVYVATQIPQYTKMLRSAAKQNLTETTQGVIYKSIEYSGENEKR